MVNEQIQVCYDNDIRVPVYLTVQWDHYTANWHPECLIVDPDGEPVGSSFYQADFYCKLCINSPYRDFLKNNIKDLFENVSAVDGLYLDITHVVDCSCGYCRKRMISKGLEPSSKKLRMKFAAETMNVFKADIIQFIRN